jgi:RNA 2',3'-cyclic 3'-phosphodiesterase
MHTFGTHLGSTGSAVFAPAPAGERLFFAIFPEPARAAELAALGQALRRRNGLGGAVIATEKLHVTLAFVGHFAPLPPDLIGAARAAGDRIVAEPFDIAFAQAGSFDSRSANHPFVLRGGAQAALHSLHAHLVQSLVATRTITGDTGYEPHLTLLRDRKLVATEALNAPVWRANDFALVRSGGESGEYRVLQRWPLGEVV